MLARVVSVPVPASLVPPPVRAVQWSDLNPNERAVLKALDGIGKGRPPKRCIAQLARLCFSDLPDQQGKSWVRNSVRRLMRGDPSWVARVGEGEYSITAEGRRALHDIVYVVHPDQDPRPREH